MNAEPSECQKSIDAGHLEDLDTWVARLKAAGDWNHRTARIARQNHQNTGDPQ